MNIEQPFGGKTVIFAGDFRQTLPVLKNGSRATIVNNLITKSKWWECVETFNLTINERIRRNNFDQSAQDFAKWLIQVGNGDKELLQHNIEASPDLIKIPDKYIYDYLYKDQVSSNANTITSFIRWCYPETENMLTTFNKAILCCKNSHVEEINEKALLLMTNNNPIECFKSVDRTDEDEHSQMLFPTEFLNSIELTGLPPHNLNLKIGAPVILLRNIDPTRGLCNGTRMMILDIARRTVKVRITNGSYAGNETYLPRIDLKTGTDNDLPFEMIRRQFPIRLEFAMTINKAQGQSLKKVGLYLPEPVFTHGQLYVALSRCGSPENTKILMQQHSMQGVFSNTEGFYTRNIVFNEVLQKKY